MSEVKSPSQILAAKAAKIDAFAKTCNEALEAQYVDESSAVKVPTAGHESWVVDAVIQRLNSNGWHAKYLTAGEIQISSQARSNFVPEGGLEGDLSGSRGVQAAELTPGSLGNTVREGGTIPDTAQPLTISCGPLTEIIRNVDVATPPESVETAVSAAAPVLQAQPVKPVYCRVDIDRFLRSTSHGSRSEVPGMTMRQSFAKLMGTEIEACSEPEATVLQQPGYHSLIAAAKFAFDSHFPLELSPDAIWVTIVQGLAQHVNAAPETWRKQFVAHEGKAVIRVARNQFLMGSAANDWANCFPEFSQQIREYIGEESHKLIVSDFSTTGALEQVVSQIALMDVVQAYFDYRTNTMCGIPYVMLKGTTADWEKLQAKVANLETKYPGLNWWLASLKPVMTELVSASKGRVDTQFWKSIYKWDSTSGGDKVNGWLLRLLPFVKNYRDKTAVQKNPLVEKYRWGDAEISSKVIPRSISVVPFIWEYYGSEVPYEFIGGIVAYDQDKETKLVRPKLGWAVRPAPAAANAQ